MNREDGDLIRRFVMSDQTEPGTSKFQKKVAGFLILAAGLLALTAVFYYIIWPSRVVITSDSTDTLFWAQASYESGQLISREYSYAAILPFGGNLLMLVFLPFFGVSMTTQILGMCLFAGIFFTAAAFFFRSLEYSWRWTSAAVFLLMLNLSASNKLREMFWGHVIYYSLGMLFLLFTLGLVNRSGDARETGQEKRRQRLLLILFVLVALAATNGFQVLALYALPVLAALFVPLYLDGARRLSDPANRVSWRLFTGIFLSVAAGLLLRLLLLGTKTDIYAGAYSSFVGMDVWQVNAETLALGWFRLLGVDIALNDPFAGLKTLVNLIRLLYSLLLILMPLHFLLRYRSITDEKIKLLGWSHLFVAALVSFLFITSKVSNAIWRLTPVVCTGSVFAVAYAFYLLKQSGAARIAKTVLAVFIAAALAAAGTIATLPVRTEGNEAYQLTEALLERDLHYGFADFWRANAVTMASDSQVIIRTVNINGEGIKPRAFQSQPSWYASQEGIAEYFILLSENEYANLEASADWSGIEEILLDEFWINDYTVLVLSQNPLAAD